MRKMVSVFAAAVVLAAGAPAGLAQVHIVNAACCGFQDPANGNSNQSIVPQGTTIQWVRTDTLPHTVTDGAAPGPGSGTVFNGSLSSTTPTFNHTFNSLGTFPYFCSPHFGFGMTGTVHVLPPASATNVGTGCQSSTAQTLTLTANSLPKVGNLSFGLTVSGGPPGAQAFLFLAGGAGPPTAVGGGCFAYLDLVSLSVFINAGITPTGPQSLSPGGTTTFTFPLPNLPGLGGLSGAGQAIVFDPGAPAGFVVSNAVSMVVGA